MNQFLYAVGAIVFQVFTLWLCMLGVLLTWDVLISKVRSRRNRQHLNAFKDQLLGATVLTVCAFAAAAADQYLLAPALGAGINFFFAG